MQLISCHDGKIQRLNSTEFQAPAGRGFSTGLESLDELLAGKVFPRGAVHEILSEPKDGRPFFFALLLAASALRETPGKTPRETPCETPGKTPGHGAVIWCDAAQEIYPPALAAHGICLQRLFPAPRSQDIIWAVAESLRCKGVAAVVAAPPRLSRIIARRLQLAAERGGGIGLLLRTPMRPASTATPPPPDGGCPPDPASAPCNDGTFN